MFKKLLAVLTQIQSTRSQTAQADEQRKAMRREAELGGKLFGDIEPGRRREFFCLDQHTWVWHEEWTDDRGQHQIRTVRYDIRPDGVLKSQNGGHYQKISDDELEHLYHAAVMYRDVVLPTVYSSYN